MLWLFCCMLVLDTVVAVLYEDNDAKHLNEACSWLVDIVKLNARGDKLVPVPLLNVSQLISRSFFSQFVTDSLLNESSSTNLMSEFLAHSHMVRLRVVCRGQYSQEANLLLTKKGFLPVIEVTSSPLTRQGYHMGITVNILESALVDMSVCEDWDEGCSNDLCNPIFLSPLPLNEQSVYILVSVKGSPEELFTKSLRKYFALNALFNDKNLIFARKVQSTLQHLIQLMAIGMQPVISVLQLTTIDILLIGGDVILASYNSWQSSATYKIDLPEVFEEAVMVCNNNDSRTGNITVSSAVALGDRVYLATNFGVVEIGIDGHSGRHVMKNIVFQACIQELRLAQQEYLKEQVLIAISRNAEGRITELYESVLDVRQHTRFRRLDLGPVCTVPSCEIVDVAHNGIEPSSLLILTRQHVGTTHYSVWRQIRSDSNPGSSSFEKVKAFPGFIMQSLRNTRYTTYSEDTMFNASNSTAKQVLDKLCVDCGAAVPVRIDRILTHTLASQAVYLIGSHILHGYIFDDFHCLSPVQEPGNFIAMATSTSGLVVAYSDNPKQLWVWLIQSHHIRLIYPSQGWSSLSHLQAGMDAMERLTLITMRFHLNGELLLIVIDGFTCSSLSGDLVFRRSEGDCLLQSCAICHQYLC